MRLFILILFFIATSSFVQTSIYDLKIQSVDGRTISLADYKGKKILVAAISPNNLQAGSLAFLDSLQMAYPSVVVLAVPANDFGGDRNTEIIISIKNNVSKKIIVAALTPVKKTAEKDQNPLLYWLTHDSENVHFDTDVITDQQLYVISESGILYAVMEKGVPIKVIENVLSQEDMKQ